MGVEIVLEDLTVRYGDQTILQSLNLRVKAARIICVVGLSGCGKTTLLKTVAGLLEKSAAKIEGAVKIDGQHTRGQLSNLEIGMVFQRPFLLPWQSSRRNIALHERLHPKSSTAGLIDKLLEIVGLSQDGEKYPHELSGGMQQRVALAREFARRPDILLLDEPFGSLDCITREQLNDYLLQFWEEFQPSVIMVTHDPEEAVYLSDEVVLLNGGRIPESGRRPVSLPRPRNHEMRNSPEFREYVEWILDGLRQTSS